MRVRVPLEEPLLGVDDWRVEVDDSVEVVRVLDGVVVRVVLVVRPERSVERIWVRVVPDELTRVEIVVVVVGVAVVAEVRDELEVLDEPDVLEVVEELDELEEPEVLEVLDVLEELDELGVVALVELVRPEVVVEVVEPVEVVVDWVELLERDGVGVPDVRVVLAAAASRRSAALRTVRCVELWAAPGVLSIGVAVYTRELRLVNEFCGYCCS